MTKAELKTFLTALSNSYPDAEFKAQEWWDRFRKFPVGALFDGLEQWKHGLYGYKAPTIADIRAMNAPTLWDPEGIFYQGMKRAMEEQKNG